MLLIRNDCDLETDSARLIYVHIELQQPDADADETVQLQETIVLPLESITATEATDNTADM